MAVSGYKRIYDADTASGDYSDQYLLIDKSGNAQAKKALVADFFMQADADAAAQAIPHAGTLMLPDTIEYSNQNTFNVSAFTAAGATFTARMQATLNAARDAGGGRVFIDPGIYDNTNSLLVYSNTTVTCTPGTVILRGKAGAYAGSATIEGNKHYATIGSIAASNVVIENLIIDHITNSTNANGIAIVPGGVEPWDGTPCDNCVIQHNTVLGMPFNWQYLIWAFKTTNTTIQHNTVDGGSTTYDANGQQEGIEVAGGSNVLVFGNTCRNVSNNGIYVATAMTLNTQRIGVRVIGNYTNACKNGIELGVGADATQSLEDCIVSDNVCRNGWQTGIKLSLTTSAITRGLTIAHNRIYNCGWYGIWCQAQSAAVTSGGIIVDGNYCEKTNLALGYVIYIWNMTGVRVTNNFVRDGIGYGIFINTCTDVDVSGNRVESVGANGINIIACTRIVVDNNVLRNYNMLAAGTYEGILVATSSYTTIRGNTFLCNPAKAETYAVNLAATCSLTYLDGNRLEYASGFNPAFNTVYAASSNVGQFDVDASATYALTNPMLRGGAMLHLVQQTGTPVAWTAVRFSNEVFNLVFSEAVTGHFRYKISRDG